MLVDKDLLPLAIMPKVGSKYHAAEAESTSSSNRTIPRQNTFTDNVVDLSSDDDDVSEDTEDEEDEAYNPVHGGWIKEEEEGMDLNDGQNAVEDEFHDDPEDTQSEDDIMSNAASYDWNNDFMPDMPFVPDPSGKIRLEVGQLFQNLHHFRQVIRDFAVHEGFQLRRIKNEKDRYTTECAYEGCGWRIHASPINDRRTFMIKTMETQHSCQKSYSMLYTYGSIVRERNPCSMATTRAECMSFEGDVMNLTTTSELIHMEQVVHQQERRRYNMYFRFFLFLCRHGVIR
ncbi:hypothetical protein ACOSQ3_006743 [Xanthoceras sorbifolium]